MASKKALSGFRDGLKSLVSTLVNQRDPIATNAFYDRHLDPNTLREVYRTGIGNKIVRLKTGYALGKEALKFDSVEDEAYYKRKLERRVKLAARWMIAFGRGIIVMVMPGDDLTAPLGAVDPDRVHLLVFSGDMVTVGLVDIDARSPRYYMPIQYNVRGYNIHHSRVIDFTYVQPPELIKPQYYYGGIGEFDLIYDQLVADGVVQRASPRIIEKASTMFYKIAGFKDAIASGNEKDMVAYFTQLENLRGIYSAGLVDQEDDLEVVSQAITNLADADQITLRRLAMVTSIPLAALIGENVKGLNSTGDTERQSLMDMVAQLQDEYLESPINELMRKLGKGAVTFNDNQWETPESSIAYEGKAVDIAFKLWQMGEPYHDYLTSKGVIEVSDFDKMFPPPDDNPLPAPDPQVGAGGGD